MLKLNLFKWKPKVRQAFSTLLKPIDYSFLSTQCTPFSFPKLESLAVLAEALNDSNPQETIEKNQLRMQERIKSHPLENLSRSSDSEESLAKIEDFVAGISGYICANILETDAQEMAKVSRYYFQQKGKSFRPRLMLFLAHSLSPKTASSFFTQQCDWAALIECLHTSSLLQDDILDNAKIRRGEKTAHEVFSVRKAAVTPIYIMGRAGRKIAEFDDLRMYEIYSSIILDLINGEQLQAIRKRRFEDLEAFMKEYLIKTFFKTASVFANGFRGVSLLLSKSSAWDPSNGDFEQMQEKLFGIGLDLGIAFQIIDDVLDFTQSADLDKSSLSDLKEGILTAPVFLSLHELKNKKDKTAYNEALTILKQQEYSRKDIETLVEVFKETSGVQRAYNIGYSHLFNSFKLTDSLGIQNQPLYPKFLHESMRILNRKK